MANLDNKQLREQARKSIEDGAVTQDYQLNVEESIKVLNDALATELVCFLRYTQHYFMANGVDSAAVAAEFLEHAEQERMHAMKLAERIEQLGGKPDLNPATLTERSHAEYKEGTTLVEMIRENLIAERIAIMAYREGITFFGDKDPTSRRLLEWILEQEEEHANDLSDFMTTFNKQSQQSKSSTGGSSKTAQQGS